MTDNRYEEEIYLEKIYSQNDEMYVLELIENLKNPKVNENLEIANCSMNSDSYQEQKENYLNEKNLFDDEEEEEEFFPDEEMSGVNNNTNKKGTNNFSLSKLNSNSKSGNTKSSGNNQKSNTTSNISGSYKSKLTAKTDTKMSIQPKLQSRSLFYFKDYLFLQVKTFLFSLTDSNSILFSNMFEEEPLNELLKFLSYFQFPRISKQIELIKHLLSVFQKQNNFYKFFVYKNFTEENLCIKDVINYFKKTIFTMPLNSKQNYFGKLSDFLKTKSNKYENLIRKIKKVFNSNNNSLGKLFHTNFFNNFDFNKIYSLNTNILEENKFFYINNQALLNRDLEFLKTKLKLFPDQKKVSNEFLTNLNVVTSEMLLTYTVAGTERRVSTMLYLKNEKNLTSENALSDFNIFKHYLDDYKDFKFENVEHPVNAHSEKALFFNLVDNYYDVAEQLANKIYRDIKYLNNLEKYHEIQNITLNEMVLYIYTMREPCKDCEEILQLSWELLCGRICLFIQDKIIQKSLKKIKVIRSPLLNSIKKIISYTFPSDGKEVCEIKNNIQNPEYFDNDIHFYKLQPPVDKKEKEFLTRRYNIDIGKNKFNGYNNQLFVPETFTFFLSMPSFKKNMEEDLDCVKKIKNYEENENKFTKLYKKYIDPENVPIINESNFENLKYSLYYTIKSLCEQYKRYRTEYEIFIENAELIDSINKKQREIAYLKIASFCKSIKGKKFPKENFKRIKDKFGNNWFSYGQEKYITDVASKILKLDKNKLRRNLLTYLLTKLPKNPDLNNSLQEILNVNPINENLIQNFIQKNHKYFIKFLQQLKERLYVDFDVIVYDGSQTFDNEINDENPDKKYILMNTKENNFSFMLRKNTNNDYLLPVKIMNSVKDYKKRNTNQCLELLNNVNTSYINSALQVLMTMNTVTSSVLNIKTSDDIKQKDKISLFNELYCLFKANNDNYKRYDPIGFLDFASKNDYNEHDPVEFLLTILKDIENEFYPKIKSTSELSHPEINPLYELIEYNSNFLIFIKENQIEEIEYDEKFNEILLKNISNESFKFGIMKEYNFTELKSVEDFKNSISMNLKIFCLGNTTGELWQLKLKNKNGKQMTIPFYLNERKNLDQRINTYLNFYFNNSYSKDNIQIIESRYEKKVIYTCNSLGYRTKAKEYLLEQIKKFKQYPEYLLIKVNRFEGGFNLNLNEELGKIISSSSSIKEIINHKTEEEKINNEERETEEIINNEEEEIKVNTNMKSKNASNLSEYLSDSKQSKVSKNSEMVKNYYDRLFMSLGEKITLGEENPTTYKFISGIFLNDSDSNLNIGRQRRFFNIINKDHTFVKVVDDSNLTLLEAELEKGSNAYLLCYRLG